MEPSADAAPDRSLPPVKSSTLQVSARKTAAAATRHASEAFDPTVPKPTPPPQRVERTTLGALMARMKVTSMDENEFDPAAYVRRTGGQTQRTMGAGLAGAALRKLGKA
jgi:hypothetical protein